MWDKTFWTDAAERSIKTFAQTAVALIAVVAPVAGMDLLEVNWIPVLAVAFIAAVISVLTSIASSFVGKKDSASLVQ